MSLYKLFKTDETIEKEGFELVLFDGDTEVKFLLARAGGKNTKYENRVESLTRGMERALRNRTVGKEKMEEIICQALADTVIMNWENVTDENDEPLKFSPAAARTLLMELPDLRNVILEESQKLENFMRVSAEEDSGNFESTSDGL